MYIVWFLWSLLPEGDFPGRESENRESEVWKNSSQRPLSTQANTRKCRKALESTQQLVRESRSESSRNCQSLPNSVSHYIPAPVARPAVFLSSPGMRAIIYHYLKQDLAVLVWCPPSFLPKVWLALFLRGWEKPSSPFEPLFAIPRYVELTEPNAAENVKRRKPNELLTPECWLKKRTGKQSSNQTSN